MNCSARYEVVSHRARAPTPYCLAASPSVLWGTGGNGLVHVSSWSSIHKLAGLGKVFDTRWPGMGSVTQESRTEGRPARCRTVPDGVGRIAEACDEGAFANPGLALSARRRNLKPLYDAAHAFGCSYKGRMIGSFGDAEVFSFHPTKFLNTLEGGAVVTNDDDLAANVRLMKNFGFVGYDNVVYIGTNGKMNEVSAAMGLTLLESLDELIAVNHRNYKQYMRELEGIPGVRLVTYDETEKCNYQYSVLEIDEAVAQVSRDHLVDILWAENVLARRYFYPGCHRMEPYRSYFPHAGLLLPETEKVVKVCFPCPRAQPLGRTR